MLKIHLKLAWRNLLRAPLRSSINLLNLAASLTLAVFILQYVLFEFSFDRNWAKKEQLFTLQRTQVEATREVITSLQIASAFAPNAVESFPEVLAASRIFRFAQGAYTAGEKVFEEPQAVVAYADARFFELFDVKRLAGKGENWLTEPNQVVLSSKYAQKYFGRTDIVGESIQYADMEQALKVQGVFEDLPENVHFEFEMLLSMSSNPYFTDAYLSETWTNSLYNTYLLLEKDTDTQALTNKFNALNQEKRGAALATNGTTESLELLAVQDIHLTTSVNGQFKESGNKKVLWGLLLAAVFILGIAYSNFANLELLKALQKAKMVGIRKVLGAQNQQIAQHFLAQAGLFSIIAVPIALLFYQIGLPSFKNYLQYTLHLPDAYQFYLIIGLVATLLLGFLLVGYLPARWMSTRNTSQLLAENSIHQKISKNKSTQALLLFQFTTAIVLILAALFTTGQVDYMLKKELGLDLEHTLVFRAPSIYESYEQLGQSWENFKSNTSQILGVSSIVSISDIPGEESFWLNTFNRNPRTQANRTEDKRLQRLSVSGDFLAGFSNELLAGRGLRYNFAADSNAVVLNEKALQVFGFESPEAAIGQTLYGSEENLNIVGVASDFHQRSLKENIQPLLITYYPSVASYLLVKTASRPSKATEKAILNTYQKAFPNNPVDYFYLNDHFLRQYATDQKLSQLLWGFTVFAIFLCCIGLFALTAHIIQERTKEIGIRKILGASVASIVGLLSKDVVKLVFIAFVIAAPIAYYFMHQWLQNFAYRIDLQWWVFVLAGVAAIVITLLTVGVQSMKTALENPVNSLKDD
ncbi:MAG: FtsX-like permease family protein [Bacteroidota bacterium]